MIESFVGKIILLIIILSYCSIDVKVKKLKKRKPTTGIKTWYFYPRETGIAVVLGNIPSQLKIPGALTF